MSFAAYVAACAGVSLWFALVWLRARSRDNWSIVDVAWSLSPALFSIPFAVFSDGPRALIWALLLALWGGRLAWHLHGRVGGGRDREDPRYADLRASWGAEVNRRMFFFYQMQSVSVWALLLLPWLASRDTAAAVRPVEWLGAALMLLAIAGEAVADSQLKRFRAEPANRGRICDVGWWAYSRHPNYFFECLVWCGAALAASGAPAGWLAWLAPIMMTWLLLRVTGVPMAEARAERLKGRAWRDYAARVSVFVPLPPRAGRDNPSA